MYLSVLQLSEHGWLQTGPAEIGHGDRSLLVLAAPEGACAAVLLSASLLGILEFAS